jgi:tetratricopeptide (TPR) repeat protein
MELIAAQALQKAVEAHKAGRLQEAEVLYKGILQTQPKHPDANHNLGVLSISLDKLDLALPFFKTALEAKPNQEQLWISYIGALIKANQRDIAKSVLGQGRKLGLVGEKVDALEAQLKLSAAVQDTASILQKQTPSFTEQRKKVSARKEKKKSTSSNRKNLNQVINPLQVEVNVLIEHYKKKQYGQAENVAKKLTQRYPNHQLSWKVLGAIFKQTGRLQESLIVNQKAVELVQNDAEAHYNLGITLKDLGRLEEAEASYKNAIAVKPDYVEAHGNLGNTLQELGRLVEAEASYAQALRLKPDFLKTRSEMLDCLYQMDKKSLFFDELDYLTKQGKANSAIGSLTCRSALRYGEEKANIFCKEPLKHVLLVDLKSRYNFEEIFVRNVKSILSEDKRSKRIQPLLSNGYQTSGNLFYKENNVTDEIQQAIRLEIERYRINFENSQEGFIKKWPKEFSLFGWLISMKSGGELQPHIHHKGWLSGSIYINVPPKSKIDSGNLVVALGIDSDTTNSHLNLKKVLDVVTGNMVLFPASLMHYTIPFESEEERVVLAFDVVPT